MTVKRYAMAVRLKEDKRDFYLKNHQDVWPEVLSEFKKNKSKKLQYIFERRLHVWLPRI